MYIDNTHVNSNIVSTHALPFFNESFGTNKLFALGGLMVKTLNKGGVIVFDELDSSLHPILTSLLVRFFQEKHNSNAQLIFTTHETFLLNKEFRSDQIWFCSKKCSWRDRIIFKPKILKELEKICRLKKWYLGGKFGAIPYVNKLKNTSDYGKKEIE